MSNSEKPKETEMSETRKAPEGADKDAADKQRRVQNLAKVSAWMRDDPEGFDKRMAELANNPEVVRKFAEMTPAKLTPEERAEAVAKFRALASETKFDLRAIIEHMRANSCASPGEALNEMLWANLKLLRGEDDYIDKGAYPEHAQLDALWQPEARQEQVSQAEAKAYFRAPK